MIGFLAWQDPAHARAGLLRSSLLLAIATATIYPHFWLLTRFIDTRRYLTYAAAALAVGCSAARYWSLCCTWQA